MSKSVPLYLANASTTPGSRRSSPHFHQYRSFTKARAFVRGLGLKSSTEWRDYCKSGQKPGDIPAEPRQTYANSGWAGHADWIGNAGRVVPGQCRSFTKARVFSFRNA